ncbi:hypothetical protein BN3659_01981 [Alistipes sp. CHKCI003]|nr:hypothetical protein BN3659_01981 [Alistipes sp. CHKCI003]
MDRGRLFSYSFHANAFRSDREPGQLCRGGSVPGREMDESSSPGS